MTSKYFQQPEPRLGNQYLEDSVLRSILNVVVPPHVRTLFEKDLVTFGDRVAPGRDVYTHGRNCELCSPRLINYNAWGRRVDLIEVHPSWDRLHDISAEEGLIAIGYERRFGCYSRLVQYLKLYLFSMSCATYTCPLAMTDGAARLLELYGGTCEPRFQPVIRDAYEHLTTRCPANFWTSGQWMTEKTGGSDVRPSETIARYDPSTSTYLLTGLKFFTSATTSEVAITLGRTRPDLPLSAFFLHTKLRYPYQLPQRQQQQQQQQHPLNGIKIHRLKDKLGTRAVPTAELSLKDTRAILVGREGEGVKVISSLFNITRIFNACSSVAACRRVLAVARDYASRRNVEGRPLSQNPLHVATLAKMEVEFRALLQFFVDVVLRFGRSECEGGESSGSDSSRSSRSAVIGCVGGFGGTGANAHNNAAMLRLLTPLLKLYTAKQSMWVISEGIECLGGTGYMEDSGLPVVLRGAQVTTIWEGTTNVLAQDVWRVLLKQNNTFSIFEETVRALVVETTRSKERRGNEGVDDPFFHVREGILSSLHLLRSFVSASLQDDELRHTNAREFAFSLSRVYACALLLSHAVTTGDRSDLVTVKRYYEEGLYVVKNEVNKVDNDRILALDLEDGSCGGRLRGVGDYDDRGSLRACL